MCRTDANGLSSRVALFPEVRPGETRGGAGLQKLESRGANPRQDVSTGTCRHMWACLGRRGRGEQKQDHVKCSIVLGAKVVGPKFPRRCRARVTHKCVL